MPTLPYHTIVMLLLCCSTFAVAAETTKRSIADGSAVTETALATADQASQALQSEFTPFSLLTRNLWDRLAEGFELSNINNPRIDKQIEFLSSGRASLERNLITANPFLYHITEQLEHNDIPLDMVLLPLIESAFDPLARSSQGAAGLWQFIPATARHYDLTVESHLDERLGVIASTRAAVRYLIDLNNTFEGDWLLTLAAYNTGPGNVRAAIKRAIKRGVEPTYWNLKLSQETSNYVPRLIAATKMISNPQEYGLTLQPLANQKIIESVDVGRRISLQLVTELTSSNLDELRELNPGLPNGRTPIYGPHRITLPVDTSKELLDRLNKLEHLPLLDRQTQLELVRRNISNPLAIDNPFSTDSTLLTYSATLDKQSYNNDQTARFETHTVQYGDTLWSLSKRLGVKISTLRSWNNLADDEPIKEGESLKIAYLTEGSDSARLMNYRVNPSDNLSTIAEKFDLAISDIRKWNSSVRDEDHIQAGQLLRIPTFPRAPVQ